MVEYVSPEFETDIEISEHHSTQGGSIRASIRAQDENKDPIWGNVTVSVLDENYDIHPYKRCDDDDEEDDDEEESLTVASQTIAIDGHAIVDFQMADFVRFENTETREFTVMAEIIDEMTGRSEQIKRKVEVHKNALKIVIDKDVTDSLTKGGKYVVKVEHIEQPLITQLIRNISWFRYRFAIMTTHSFT